MVEAVASHFNDSPTYSRATFEVRNLDLFLNGHVPTKEARQALIEVARKQVPSARVRSNLNIVVPVPSMLQADLDQGILRLHGALPTPELIADLKRIGEALDFSVLTPGLVASSHVDPAPWNANLAPFLKQFLLGATSASVRIGGEEWLLQREAANEEDAQRLRDLAIAMLPTGTKLIDDVKVQAPDLPSRLEIWRENDRIIVSGVVPDEARRAFILTAVTQTIGENVTNDLSLDRKVKSPEWLPSLTSILESLFAEGEQQGLEVTGEQVKISGTFATKEECAELLEIAGDSFGIGFVIESGLSTNSEMRPPPPHLEMEATFSEHALEIAGIVPDDQSRDRIIGAFRRAYPGALLKQTEIERDSRISEPEWMEALLDFIPRLPTHVEDEGTFRIVKRSASLSGVAKTKASVDGLGLKLQRMFAEGFSIENQVIPSASNQPQFQTWHQGAIYFDAGSSRVSSDQLSKVEIGARQYRDAGTHAVILIEAFADESGSASQNLSLGSRRAHSVREALSELKVPVPAMRLVGVTIVKSSSSPELDRRVEFTIIP